MNESTMTSGSALHAGEDAAQREADHAAHHTVDHAAIRRVRERQVPDLDLDALADIFQMLASTARLRIVEALAGGELCVCDLSEVVGVSESAVSHHLRHLRQLRLVRVRREGRRAFYRLDDDHVTDLFRTGLEHVHE